MRLSFLILLLISSCQRDTAAPPDAFVEVAEVKKEDVRDYVEAIGNVFEWSLIQIRPQVQGILEKAYVHQGDYVKAGDLLYEIDKRPYVSAVKQAEAAVERDRATLNLSKKTLERYTQLAEKDYIAKLTFEQYQTNVKTAEASLAANVAALEIAKINLSYCTITSPIDGKIGIFQIYPGNLVVVNDPSALVEIRQISPIDIRFSIPQQDFQSVQDYANHHKLSFDAFLPYEHERQFRGELYFIDNHIDLSTGMILLKGKIPNEDCTLWPGEFIRVRLYTKMQKNALLVHGAALQTGQKGTFVYKVQKDMTVEPIYIELGIRRGDDLVLKKGDLRAGDKIVVNGQINLFKGAKVVIKKSNEKTS